MILCSLALALSQLGDSVWSSRQVHAEDTKVIELALVQYWKLDRAEGPTVCVPDRSSGPLSGYTPIVQGDSKVKPVAVDPMGGQNLIARNAFPISLSWFRPQSARIRLVGQNDPEKHRFGHGDFRQYTWLLMPGYSKDRTKALVCFRFNWSMHSGEATVWLSKVDGVWKVTDSRDVFYV